MVPTHLAFPTDTHLTLRYHSTIFTIFSQQNLLELLTYIYVQWSMDPSYVIM
jgi:hypothetical protein